MEARQSVMVQVRDGERCTGRDGTGRNWCYTQLVTVYNNTKHLSLWPLYRSFYFEGRTSCGFGGMAEEVEPGQRQTYELSFRLGNCPIKNQLEGLVRGQNLSPLTSDMELFYKYRIEFHDQDPRLSEYEVPVMTEEQSGQLIVPQGTPRNFCIHYSFKCIDDPTVC